MARGKIDTDKREDETAVYKPVKPKKSAVKAEAPKEEKKTERRAPKRYEPEQQLSGREKREKARVAAVAKDRRRAVSRAGDAGVTLIALLTYARRDPPSVPSNGTRSSVPAGSRLLPAESTIKRPAAPACGRFLFTRRQSARSWAYFLKASSTISAIIAALR